MTCEFYWISGSPFAWRVHLALEFKSVTYRSRLLEASTGEHQSPAFLTLNPRGRVPVLKDGNDVIYESVAVLAYLEARHPEPRLFGSSPIESGFVWQRVQEIENYVRNPLLRVAIAILNGEVKQEPYELRTLIDLCHEQLDWIENVLSEAQWVSGEAISAADFVLYPVLKMFLRAGEKPVADALNLGEIAFQKRSPATAQWTTQIEKLPGFGRTYPPHWQN